MDDAPPLKKEDRGISVEGAGYKARSVAAVVGVSPSIYSSFSFDLLTKLLTQGDSNKVSCQMFRRMKGYIVYPIAPWEYVLRVLPFTFVLRNVE